MHVTIYVSIKWILCKAWIHLLFIWNQFFWLFIFCFSSFLRNFVFCVCKCDSRKFENLGKCCTKKKKKNHPTSIRPKIIFQVQMQIQNVFKNLLTVRLMAFSYLDLYIWVLKTIVYRLSHSHYGAFNDNLTAVIGKLYNNNIQVSHSSYQFYLNLWMSARRLLRM